eukprot:TRINITY_DN3386_c0_g2_i2.p1 TRINITY_DN3386_c0_g2~~TRINITY_DN3386_c0_g2_i2.p1  ORF type:complete len:914 (+),score=231.48 TRINITY_DN3386_c0_g2_i2:208-2742(+)
MAEILKSREYAILELKELEVAERVSFIRAYLNKKSKKLDENQEFSIANSPQAGNPRYLKTLLDDISVWGAYDQLNDRIKRYLQASNSSQLYEIILERMESDYSPDIVREFLSLLWASKRGLYIESELGQILGNKGIEYNLWNTVYLGVEELLYSSGGLTYFSNDDIKIAVERRFVGNEEEQKRRHTELANFFRKVSGEGITERVVVELPYQYESSSNWDALHACITDLRMFNDLYTDSHKYDLFRYWRQLEQIKKEYDPFDSYSRSLSRGDNFPGEVIVGHLFYKVASFLEEIAKFDGALKIYAQSRHYYTISSQNLFVAKVDESVANVALIQAKFSEAEATLEKALHLYIREKGEEDLDVARVLNMLGRVYVDLNRFEKAQEKFEKSLQITQVKLGPSDYRVGMTLANMTTLYERLGNSKKALECGKQALKIFEEEFGPDDYNVCPVLVSLGRIYMNGKQFDEAKKVFKRALNISQQKLGNDHPSTAEVSYEMGCFFFVAPEKTKRSNTNVKDKLKNKDFWKDKFDKTSPDTVVIAAENVELKSGWSKDKAEDLFLSALKVFRDAYGEEHPSLSRVYNRLGSLYIEQAQFAKAEDNLHKALAILLKVYGENHTRIAQTYKHLLTLYELQEEWDKAYEAGEKVLSIAEKVLSHSADIMSNVLLRLGTIAGSAGDKQKARAFMERAKSVLIQAYGPEHEELKTIDGLIKQMSIPVPPPLPPLGKLVNLEDLRAQANIVTEEQKKEVTGWTAVLQAIQNVGTNKTAVLRHCGQTREGSADTAGQAKKKCVRRNEEQKKGWWKQNYKYDKALPVTPTPPPPPPPGYKPAPPASKIPPPPPGGPPILK